MEVLFLLLLSGLCVADRTDSRSRRPSSRFVPPPPGNTNVGNKIADPVESRDDSSSAPAIVDDCMPFAEVPGLVGRMAAGEAPAVCSFQDGSIGVSAGETSPPPPATGPPLEARAPLAPLSLPTGSSKHLGKAVRELDAIVRLERKMRGEAPLPPGSPEWLQSLHFMSDADTQHQGRRALRDLTVIQLARNGSNAAASDISTTTTRRRLNGGKIKRVMVRKKMVGEQRVPGCEVEPDISCDKESKYRTADGSCNNLKTPSLGRSGTGLHRLINSTYMDGIFSPRLWDSRGTPLPSARVLSATLLSTDSDVDGRVAVSLPVFAEFISHDLQRTGVFRLAADRPIDCCATNAHPLCLPITVKTDDSVFGASGRRCLSMARSLPAPERQCQPRPATPLSRQTAFLDGSGLYGATEAESRRLRQMDGGRMRSNDRLPPPRTVRSTPEDATEDNDSIDNTKKSNARRRRSAYGGPDVGFPNGGLFQSQPFAAQLGGLPAPYFTDSFGPFDGPLGTPIGRPLNGPMVLQHRHTDRVGLLAGFGDGHLNAPLKYGARGTAVRGAAPQSQVTFSNEFVSTSTRIQHPTANNPRGETIDAYNVHQLVAANGGRDRKQKTSKNISHSHDKEESESLFSSRVHKKPFSPDLASDRSDSFSSGFDENIEATDKFSSSFRHHRRPSAHYTPPKGYASPLGKNSDDQPRKSYGAPKPRQHVTQVFPGSNQAFGSLLLNDHLVSGFSPSKNEFLGRIVVGGPDGASPGGFPASQPLSTFPERASQDEVEELFPGRTLADDITAGAVSSRLKAPRHRPATGALLDLTLTDEVPENAELVGGESADLTFQSSRIPEHPKPDRGALLGLTSLTEVEDPLGTRGNSIFVPTSNTSPSLPTDQSCDAGCRGCTCFDAGNQRANEQPHGLLMHTIWLREHNRVAAELSNNHPDWDDERLFQEARRVVVAELQHITYNEFVPATLGYQYAAERGLLPLSVGYSPLYNVSADPRPAVEFSTAAFRASHSKLQAMLRLVARSGRVDNQALSDGIFEPSALNERNFFVKLARGMIDQPAERTDTNFASTVHGKLFGGGDLPALTIQRGRDQGLATYPSVVQHCNGNTIASWDDFSALMEPKAVEALRAAYASPFDVDLYVGGMMERHAAGSDLGPTFQCLVGDMFYRLRTGDRFFYDNANQAGSFNEEQLDELRKSSTARLLCDNVGGDFDGVQPMAMLRPDERENPIVSCRSQALPQIDFSIF